jgi:predicted dienelactone hydrolase
VLAATLVVVGLGIGIALSSLSSGRTSTPGHPSADRQVTSPRTVSTVTRPRPAPADTKDIRVARVGVTLTEPSSAADATDHTASGSPLRVLPTMVRFPVAASGGRPLAGAPYPLILFSQGFDESTGAYAGLLDAWARAGYVVAAPTYPFTAPSGTTELNESDIINHPADLRFVIASLLQMTRDPDSPLHRLIDPNRVAVAGQSDGGDVSLAVAANSCCRDGVVKAAIILSGAELASFGGAYFTDGSVPLLVTQGNEDTINPPGCSAQVYDQAPQPKYYLYIAGARHLPPYLMPGPIRTGVERVTIAFLNAYVKDPSSGPSASVAVSGLPPQEKLTSAATAPGPPSAYCPGAP